MQIHTFPGYKKVYNNLNHSKNGFINETFSKFVNMIKFNFSVINVINVN